MGASLRYRIVGDQGPSLVLVHGAGASSLAWLRVLPAAARAARAIALDLPGHGRSEGPGCDRIEAYREAVRAFVQGLGLERPYLAGHSMGGAVALDYALAYPGEVAGLVLCSTAARLRVGAELLELLERRFSAFHRFFAGVAFGPGVRPADAEAAARDLLSAPPEVTLADFRACDAFDLGDRILALRTRVLVLCGDADRLTPPAQSEALATALGGAELARVPGAGHMLPWEEPARVAAAIAAFLGGEAPDRDH